jgi:hypothetical protein
MAQVYINSLNTGFNSLGTSFYPVGMGLSVNLRNQGGYKTWKGEGINSNPTGVAAGHIRPLTNNDPGNIFPGPFGKPRPLTPWGKPALGVKTRKRKNKSDMFIIRSRS